MLTRNFNISISILATKMIFMQPYDLLSITQEVTSRWECNPSVLITSFLELNDKQ